MPDGGSSVNITVVIVSFALYTLAIVAIGLWSARFAKRSDEDYFLAGRSLNGWVAALSASASSESGWVTLGLVGWAFTEGVKAYWIIPGCLLGFLFNWFVVAGPMHDRARQLNALTLPDFFAFHFKERWPLIRVLNVTVILVAMTLYVSAQFAAAGKAFDATFGSSPAPAAAETAEDPTVSESNATVTQSADETRGRNQSVFLGLSRYQLGVLIGAFIVLIYTVSGGFRAVCWTDFLQALLMVGTLVIFPMYLLLYEGGFAFIAEQLRWVHAQEIAAWIAQQGPLGMFDIASYPQNPLAFTPRAATIAMIGFLLGHGALGINFGYPGQPHVLVRFMALRERKEARLAGVVAFCWGLCVYFGAVTIGLMARAMTAAGESWAQPMLDDPDIYGELGLVLSAMHMLPGILSGMVLAAVLAAICSTADSQLVVAASSAANDLYARLLSRGKAESHVWINRLVVLVLGVIAVAIVFDEQVRVYKFVLTYGWALLGAAIGPQLILLLFWKRASYAGCLAGMLVGFALALVWPSVYDERTTGVHIYNLPLAFIAALIVNVVVSLATKPPAPIDADAENNS